MGKVSAAELANKNFCNTKNLKKIITIKTEKIQFNFKNIFLNDFKLCKNMLITFKVMNIFTA